jgi:hypothetical protein
MVWADAPAAGEPQLDIAADAPADVPLEAFGDAWIDAAAAGEPQLDVAADAPADVPLEAFGDAWIDAAAAGEPQLDVAADPDIQSREALSGGLEIETSTDQSLDDATTQLAAHAEPVLDIPPELIPRMLGMIQSYGPAWFKMWSLELKERPERLPVVLGEVTADSVLLAQANDARIQAALLAALAAYTSPPVHPARLPGSASLPSPVMASQGNNDQDEVPDWLSLRVKWNGHGGGA